jgi:glycosyltransferase involved in cell wall biosynthesis
MLTSRKETPVPVALHFRRAGFRGLLESFFMRIPFVGRIESCESNSPIHGRKLLAASLSTSFAGPKRWPRDPAALAEAIHAALSLGASAREAVRRRSRAKIADAYSLERMTRDTLNVYAEALSR